MAWEWYTTQPCSQWVSNSWLQYMSWSRITQENRHLNPFDNNQNNYVVIYNRIHLFSLIYTCSRSLPRVNIIGRNYLSSTYYFRIKHEFGQSQNTYIGYLIVCIILIFILYLWTTFIVPHHWRLWDLRIRQHVCIHICVAPCCYHCTPFTYTINS